jgi:hypothetical protein
MFGTCWAGDLALVIALVSLWVCAAMACAKCVGIRSTIFLKMRRVRHYFSLLSNVNFFFKVQVVCEAVHLSQWEIFISSLVVR